jgi:hypothetical protein
VCNCQFQSRRKEKIPDSQEYIYVYSRLRTLQFHCQNFTPVSLLNNSVL